MHSTMLADRLILIVDDEPLIAMDLVHTFESAGAKVVHARSVREALTLSEDPDLAAAVVDHILEDGPATALCDRLKERAIPFFVYSGYPAPDVLLVSKPALPHQLVAKLAELLRPNAAPAPSNQLVHPDRSCLQLS